MAKVALLTVHGMGETKRHYSEDLRSSLVERLGDKFENLAFCSIYYQDVLQGNQQAVWKSIDEHSKVHYDDLRKFVLFGFGDAAGLENRKELPGSTYVQAQIRIAQELLRAYQEVGSGGHVVAISQSLGCQVLSSYLWDAQQAFKQQGGAGKGASVGIWTDIDAYAQAITGGRGLTADEKLFLAGTNLNRWVTTGCNIPIFVAAHQQMDIKPIDPPNADFHWLNMFDPDDVLGWPLRPLSPGYHDLVEDRSINAGQGAIDWILKSWNPMSHTAYWSDDDVLDPLVEMLEHYL